MTTIFSLNNVCIAVQQLGNAMDDAQNVCQAVGVVAVGMLAAIAALFALILPPLAIPAFYYVVTAFYPRTDPSVAEDIFVFDQNQKLEEDQNIVAEQNGEYAQALEWDRARATWDQTCRAEFFRNEYHALAEETHQFVCVLGVEKDIWGAQDKLLPLGQVFPSEWDQITERCAIVETRYVECSEQFEKLCKDHQRECEKEFDAITESYSSTIELVTLWQEGGSISPRLAPLVDRPLALWKSSWEESRLILKENCARLTMMKPKLQECDRLVKNPAFKGNIGTIPLIKLEPFKEIFSDEYSKNFDAFIKATKAEYEKCRMRFDQLSQEQQKNYQSEFKELEGFHQEIQNSLSLWKSREALLSNFLELKAGSNHLA